MAELAVEDRLRFGDIRVRERAQCGVCGGGSGQEGEADCSCWALEDGRKRVVPLLDMPRAPMRWGGR